MHAPTKIAIIGIGRWGRNLLREFSQLPSCEIACLFYQGNPDTTQWLVENYPNLRIASSLEEIEKDTSIDAVVIATPIITHYEIARRMLIAEKHVFVEKPLCKTESEALELIDLSKRTSKLLFVGYTFIYSQVLAKLEEALKQKQAPIQSLFFSWEKWGSFQESLVENLLCHDVAIATMLLGGVSHPERLFSHQGLSPEDIAGFSFTGKNNESVVSHINRFSRMKKKSLLVKTEASLYLWENESLFEMQDNALQEIFTSSSSQLELECEAFISSIRESTVPRTNGEFGAKISKTLGSITPLE